LTALGRNDFKNENEYYESLTGIMILVDGLLELTRIKKILLEALRNK